MKIMNAFLSIKKRFGVIVSCCIVFFVILGVGWQVISSRQEKVIRAIAEQYWGLVTQKNYDAAMNMLYFKPEHDNIREMTERCMPLEVIYSYDLKTVKKLNQDLYEISVNVITNYTFATQTPIESVYHYVAKIDDTWKYLLRDEEIPDDICPFPREEEEYIRDV